MKKYDSIIIGFGKGGKTLAYDLAKNYHQKVALIEQSNKMYGGTCINIGCIPTKRLVHDSFTSSKTDDYYKESINSKNELVERLREKNYERVNVSGTDIINARASFISKNEIEVFFDDGTKEILWADKFFINTGAKTIVPNIEGIDNEFVYDSTQLQNLKQLPKSLIIIGAGYVGCEFASIYKNYGTKVTILESSNSFLAREEQVISDSIKNHFENEGITLITNVIIKKIVPLKNSVSIEIEVNGNKRILESDAILYSTGRKPNIENLNLEKIGIQFDEKGKIKVNKHLQTSHSNIYVLGDVVGGLQFTYISLDDYRIVKSHLFDNGKYNLDLRNNVPYSVFISPSFSRVGLTEKEALDKGFKIKTNSILASQIIKANVVKNTVGILKVIVDVDTNLILGAHLFVEESHEIINLIKMAMDNKIKYTYLKNQVFTHPTIIEGFNDLFDF